MVNIPRQRLYVSHIDVVYGDQPSEAPSDRVRALGDETDDINYQYGGKYVWLVPRYTAVRPAAVVGFELAVQEPANWALKDLAKGAGGEHRYLLPVKDVTKEAKVTELALLRLNEATGQPPAGWSGISGDINRHRGGTYLYLLWKTAA